MRLLWLPPFVELIVLQRERGGCLVQRSPVRFFGFEARMTYEFFSILLHHRKIFVSFVSSRTFYLVLILFFFIHEIVSMNENSSHSCGMNYLLHFFFGSDTKELLDGSSIMEFAA